VTGFILGLTILGASLGLVAALMGQGPRCAGVGPYEVLSERIKQGAAEKVDIPGKLVQVSGTGPRFDEEAPCTMQEIALANSGRGGMVALYLRDPLSGCTLYLTESGDEIPGLGPDARFYDPCHGASFTLEGACSETRTGPCDKGLYRFAVEFSDGGYAVNLRQPPTRVEPLINTRPAFSRS
jgi:hypothetical protein